MSKLTFDLKKSTPVSINPVVSQVIINPGDIEVGNFEFYGVNYLLKFHLELLDSQGTFIAEATGFSDSNIQELIQDVQKEKENLDWKFIVVDIETTQNYVPFKELVLEKVQTLEVELTSEAKAKLSETLESIEGFENKIKKFKEKLKDKANKFQDKQKQDFECFVDKANKKVEKLKTKVKNKDFTKKEAAALGAGAALLVAALFSKKK